MAVVGEEDPPMRRKYREMLREALGEHHKLVALEVFGGNQGTAKAELSKYLSGERGGRVFQIIEAIYKFGNREFIRRWHDERLKPHDPASTLAEIGEQLDLLEHKFELVREVAKELAEVIPLKKHMK